MSEDPQAGVERRAAARHLLADPLFCKEHDPDTFRLVRRHETELDRWFTQRLGYRLHVGADTARLFKSGALPANRPLRTAGGRPFHRLEYVLLLITLASTIAGPSVVSLRDLVDLVRSAAVDAGVELTNDASERRALVTVLRWMIEHGLATEVHARVEDYGEDEQADAVLRLRPDRIALLPLPALTGFADAENLLARAVHRGAVRQWMRARLVEDPVVYRADLDDAEWSELRRRLGEEERYLDEMFGLVLEARAEGIAAIDPAGELAEARFPAGGTVQHAALLLVEALRRQGAGAAGEWVSADQLAELTAELVAAHARRWSRDLVDSPEVLARRAVAVLVQARLAERRAGIGGDEVRLLAGAGRFVAAERADSSGAGRPGPDGAGRGAGAGAAAGRRQAVQESLW